MEFLGIFSRKEADYMVFETVTSSNEVGVPSEVILTDGRFGQIVWLDSDGEEVEVWASAEKAVLFVDQYGCEHLFKDFATMSEYAMHEELPFVNSHVINGRLTYFGNKEVPSYKLRDY